MCRTGGFTVSLMYSLLTHTVCAVHKLLPRACTSVRDMHISEVQYVHACCPPLHAYMVCTSVRDMYISEVHYVHACCHPLHTYMACTSARDAHIVIKNRLVVVYEWLRGGWAVVNRLLGWCTMWLPPIAGVEMLVSWCELCS